MPLDISTSVLTILRAHHFVEFNNINAYLEEITTKNLDYLWKVYGFPNVFPCAIEVCEIRKYKL